MSVTGITPEVADETLKNMQISVFPMLEKFWNQIVIYMIDDKFESMRIAIIALSIYTFWKLKGKQWWHEFNEKHNIFR